ncbi:hypothetical protein GCM10009347_43080 [Shewanella algicola]|uniref:DUF4304 domain-containing protein n=1 Tax=Shewanella algicola TaxID=640633 RepID=A0A9X1Z759_9GAMM|nr:DUF4304 domain-containing protein [Shewanella algicola]MCL1107601.1 DUF4304 domain-containing protein [Shewanella algicola]GGP74517.1 hypothetical protein GCM10009347_43080 [Shewanella algicola]
MIKELIKLYIAPFLKRLGFKKKGSTWNREINGVVHVIDIQSTKARVDGTELFTINIGVFINELWQIFWNKEVPQFVKEENCYPRFRLGYLLSGFDPKRRDQWWQINTEEDIEKIWKELDVIFLKHCLPFFDEIESVGDLLGISDKTRPNMPSEKLSHGILLNMTDNKEEGDRLIGELVSDSHWGNRATEISERLSQRS